MTNQPRPTPLNYLEDKWDCELDGLDDIDEINPTEPGA